MSVLDELETSMNRAGALRTIVLSTVVAGGLVLPLATPAAARAVPAGCVTKTLRAGVDDEFCVARLQSLLNYDRFRFGQAPIAVDRRYGPLTDGRVRVVQSRSWITIDGIVGPGTWRVLCVPDAAGFTAMQVSVGCATL